MKNKAEGGRLKVVRHWPFKPSALVSINLSILIIMSCSFLAGSQIRSRKARSLPGGKGRFSAGLFFIEKKSVTSIKPGLSRGQKRSLPALLAWCCPGQSGRRGRRDGRRRDSG